MNHSFDQEFTSFSQKHIHPPKKTHKNQNKSTGYWSYLSAEEIWLQKTHFLILEHWEKSSQMARISFNMAAPENVARLALSQPQNRWKHE